MSTPTPNTARNFETVVTQADHVLHHADVIVVGSGMGGLMTAAVLGAYGKKVVVLEQHDTPGGSLHSFQQGSEWVCAGWHYVGVPSKVMKIIWDYITDFQVMDNDPEEVYDTYYGVGSLNGHNLEERMGISKKDFRRCAGYFDVLLGVKILPAPLAWLLWAWYRLSGRYREANMNYGDWCKKMAKTDRENPLWWVQRGDHGQPKESTCAMLGATLVDHYRKGQIHPRGGIRELVLRICQRVAKNGGAVILKAPVTKVLVKNNKVTGVEVAGSQIVNAKEVVLSNGVWNLTKLLGSQTPSKYGWILSKLGPSTGHGGVFLTFTGKKHQDLGVPPGAVWMYDVEPMLFISSKNSETGCVVYIIWEMPYVPRGGEYLAAKDDYSTRTYQAALKRFPLLAQHDQFDSATPATTEHYLASQLGCSYGLANSPNRFSDYSLIRALRPATGISGLYLTGQDVALCGIGGAMAGALITICSMQHPGLGILFGNPFSLLGKLNYIAMKGQQSQGQQQEPTA